MFISGGSECSTVFMFNEKIVGQYSELATTGK